MTREPLKLISNSVLTNLAASVATNIDRYVTGNFNDLAKENGWEIETSVASHEPLELAKLSPSGGAESEIGNSLIVFNSFHGMTPALAREERLWARLCHVECLEFSRQRWLRSSTDPEGQVRKHFFAPSLPGSRDDNAVGRLWWNGYVASLATPGDIERGLRALLSRANRRLQIIDRADTAFRKPLLQGIVRLLIRESWFDTRDDAVADFMHEVNRQSGGIVFEALSNSSIDDHLNRCLATAKLRKKS